MAVTINRSILPSRFLRRYVPAGLMAVAEALALFFLVQRLGLWPLAVVLVVVIQWWSLRPGGTVMAARRLGLILERMPALLMGLSTVLIVATGLRLATQVAVLVLYVAWRVWWGSRPAKAPSGLANLLVVQAVAFESIFLMAAVWRTPSWIIIGLVWFGAYVSVFATLSRRGERAAGVMAATWALVAAEISWVLLLWLFTYTTSGGYVLVPQPALVLTAMAYCFGSIYVSQREGSLSRGRLAEYLLIGLSLMGIVIIGTSWRGGI